MRWLITWLIPLAKWGPITIGAVGFLGYLPLKEVLSRHSTHQTQKPISAKVHASVRQETIEGIFRRVQSIKRHFQESQAVAYPELMELGVKNPLAHYKEIEFWKVVYTQFSIDEGLLHDAENVSMIFETFSLKDLPPDAQTEFIQRKKEDWSEKFRSIHEKRFVPAEMSQEEKHIFEKYASLYASDENLFIKLSNTKRIRFQRGLKEEFQEALIRSGKYLSMIEEIFLEEGIPLVIARLPLLESGFNPYARSKAGAVGIWQFIETTGNRYLTINEFLDERKDPYLATRAAAKLLKKNYEQLESWPLAILAFNQGRNSMIRAVEETGSNRLDQVIEKYQGDRFGFVGRNYFASFIAASQIDRAPQTYFGTLKRANPEETVRVGVADFIPAKALEVYMGLDFEALKALNPALLGKKTKGNIWIPAGARINLPKTWGSELGGPKEAFWKKYLSVPNKFKRRGPA